MKTKTSFNADRLIGLSAILISLLTLFIFLYQTNLLKEQSRLSVRPRLTFSKNINKSITVNDLDSINSTVINFRLTLRNNGLGPAIIESNSVAHGNRQYAVISFFDEVYPKLREYGVFAQISELQVGEAVQVSETIDIFSYEYDLTNENKIKEYLGISDFYELPFDVLVEYSSMYEEKWKANSSIKGHPERID